MRSRQARRSGDHGSSGKLPPQTRGTNPRHEREAQTQGTNARHKRKAQTPRAAVAMPSAGVEVVVTAVALAHQLLANRYLRAALGWSRPRRAGITGAIGEQ